jgi:type III secretion system YscD/HrpQ family protein
MAARFVAEEGLLKGQIFSLEMGDEWYIGRDPEVSQILLEDPSVSRRHVLCRRTPEGFLIENLSITNPILINESPVYAPQILQNDDTVKIGDGLYRFHDNLVENLEAQEPEQEPETSFQAPSTPEIQDKIDEAPMQDVKERETTEEEEPHDSIFEMETPEEEEQLAEVSFDLTDLGRWLLKVVSGPNNGAEFTMQSDRSYVLGKDPHSCDIIFQDTSISRQHARLTINPENLITIEDLNSRNGTFIDGEKITGSHTLSPNVLVTLGTTAFVIYDREGEMHTIISPLLPSIAKILQKEEVKSEVPSPAPAVTEEPPAKMAEPEPKTQETKKASHLGAFILIAILTSLFIIVGIGITTLFKTEPIVVQPEVNTEELLRNALQTYPDIRYSFNKSTGRVLLVGHVLTPTDKTRLMYTLEGIKSLKGIDDSGIIIDEYVWREINQDLTKIPNWKGVSVYASSPGHFVITGYLKTNEEAQKLWEYLNKNFAYLDLLERKVLVEEDVMSTVNTALEKQGFREVLVQLSNGELTLAGHVLTAKKADLDKLIDEFKKIPGVRDVRNYVVELEPAQSMINITDKYEVTGFSHIGNINISVVINGRILTEGSSLDGMTITKITPNTIFLEKEGVQYRIDYNR